MRYQKTHRFITPEMIAKKMILLSSDIKDWSGTSRTKGSFWYNLAKNFWVMPSEKQIQNLMDKFRLNLRGLRAAFENIVRSDGFIAATQSGDSVDPCLNKERKHSKEKLRCDRCETWYDEAFIKKTVNRAILCSTYMCPNRGKKTKFKFPSTAEDQVNRETEAEKSNLRTTLEEYDGIAQEIPHRVQAKPPKLSTKKIFCPRAKKVFIMEINESSDSDQDDDSAVTLPTVFRKPNLEELAEEISNLDAASTAVPGSSSSNENFVEAAGKLSVHLTDASENNPVEPTEISVDSADGDAHEVASSDAKNDQDICKVAMMQVPLHPWVTQKLRGQIRNFRRPQSRNVVDEDCQVVQEVWVTKAKLPIKSEALKESMRILLKKDPTKVTLSDDDDDELSSSANQIDNIVIVDEVIRKKGPKINLSNNSMERRNKFTIQFNRG